jgi:hypothetical protein
LRIHDFDYIFIADGHIKFARVRRQSDPAGTLADFDGGLNLMRLAVNDADSVAVFIGDKDAASGRRKSMQ